MSLATLIVQICLGEYTLELPGILTFRRVRVEPLSKNPGTTPEPHRFYKKTCYKNIRVVEKNT